MTDVSCDEDGVVRQSDRRDTQVHRGATRLYSLEVIEDFLGGIVKEQDGPMTKVFEQVNEQPVAVGQPSLRNG